MRIYNFLIKNNTRKAPFKPVFWIGGLEHFDFSIYFFLVYISNFLIKKSLWYCKQSMLYKKTPKRNSTQNGKMHTGLCGTSIYDRV